MAINSSLPKETIQIEGKEKITSIYEVNTFDPFKKSESIVKIVDLDGYVSVFIPHVSPVRRVYISSPIYNPSIELPYVTKIKISRLEAIGATGVIDSEMYVEGLNIFKFPEEFGSLISDIQIATTSQEQKEVSISVYAWSDEV